MTRNGFLCGAIAALAVIPVVNAAGFDDKVRDEFFAGFFGDQAALQRAMKAAEATIAENSKDAPQALAWHGGALMVESGAKFQTGDYAAGTELWAKGIAEMQKAGELEPENLAVLIPRAAIWLGVSRRAPPERAHPLLVAVGPRREGATVAIAARVRDGRLRVEVSDDGPGFDATAGLKPGHGLELLQNRLVSLFGPEASLEMAAGDGLTRVSISVAA